MNKDQFFAKWHEFKGKIKEKWGKLTDNEIEQVHGRMDQLSAYLQKKYAWAKERADKEISNWCTSCEHEKEYKSKAGHKENRDMSHPSHREEHGSMFKEESSGSRYDLNHRKENTTDRFVQKREEGGEYKKTSHGSGEYKEKKRKAG
jgi:uncharacterized protein YjbJ (UPF0337 family)